jgi:hypothetical protein
MARKPPFRQRMVDAVEIGGARGYDEVTILPDGTVKLRKTTSTDIIPRQVEDDEPNEIDTILENRKKAKIEAKP